ncbi:MAG: cob(I)yrinic acid a,c-diamide adenosyltransferase [Bacillota bacterium]
MKIYTRTGDRGETSLRWGQRVPKDALRVEAYGAVDEANCLIGLALAHLQAPGDGPAPAVLGRIREILLRVQRELFDVGADLAVPPERNKGEAPRITAAHVAGLEAAIDELDGGLPPLRHFILPGGSLAAAALQTARAVTRRAERRLVTLARQEPVDPELLRYLNRLSDLLFVCARAVNHALGIQEPPVTWNR